ncbi:tumor suppressor candidate 2-like [Gigantopelta aegis]|uniref:tumor suppressor candidate 2-like n=1 Tax=Gigantopelta aegis TaxID=1735272 RepID=UPI001B887BB5|nr:tumor suppressor candidate 2-like [Gigantopelta aegis]
MGQTTSSLASKLVRPVSWMLGRNALTDEKNAYHGATPFVYTRQGSMYFDDDGDLAHEFFEEVVVNKRSVMRKCHQNLIPQGEVELSHPRLHVDLPVIMCEALPR